MSADVFIVHSEESHMSATEQIGRDRTEIANDNGKTNSTMATNSKKESEKVITIAFTRH